MAKLTLTLDTEDQTMSVDVDGTGVENINDVTVSNWGSPDDPKFSFYVTSYEKVGGVHKMTRLMARESPEAVRSAAAGERLSPSRSVAGFVETPGKTPGQQQMEDWLAYSRRGR